MIITAEPGKDPPGFAGRPLAWGRTETTAVPHGVVRAFALATDLQHLLKSDDAKITLTLVVVAVLTFLLGFGIRDVLARVAARRRAPAAVEENF